MNWHLAAYIASLGNVTNSDVTAASDDVLGVRNNHLILTEEFNLIAVAAQGSLLSRLRFGNAGLTQLGSNHIWPINVSATVPDNVAVMDRRDYPIRLPMNEEITLEASTTAVGPSDVSALLYLAAPDYDGSIPRGLDRLQARATVTIVAGAESAWTALANITMERDLLNGVYSVVGCNVVAANALAFRLRFPDAPTNRGKQYRPGGPVQDTAAIRPNLHVLPYLGEWGRFHTFSLPQIQCLDDSAGGTYEVRLDLVYLGKDRSLLNSY